MADKITTLKLVDNTDVFPNTKEENIPDSIMRVADLGKHVNALKSINMNGDIDSTTSTADIATYQTADIGTLNVSGLSQFEGKATFGSDVEADGRLILNSADDVVDKDGNKLIASVQLDEFKKNYYATAGKFRFAGIHINGYEGEGTNNEIIDPESTKWTDLTQMYAGSGYYSFGQLVTDKPIIFPDFYSGAKENQVSAYGLIDGFENPMVQFGNANLLGQRLFENYQGKSITVAEGKKFSLYGYCSAIFNNDTNLEEIGEFDLSQAESLGAAFASCSSLLHIHCKHFPVSFDIHWSTKLSQEALVEIISNLDPVTTPQTLTMGATNLAKLTQDQILVATGKGWTIA